MTDWRDQSACLDVDPDTFDPAICDMRYGSRDEAVAEALAICAVCPVQAQCLEARFDDKWLIVGGTTPEQRESRRRKARAENRKNAA